MKLEIIGKGEQTHYYLSKSVRDGKRVSTIRIRSLGSYKKLKEEHDDPLAYCREQVRLANLEAKSQIFSFDENINFTEKIEARESNISSSTYKNIGFKYLEKILDDLNLKKFVDKHCENLKIKYSLTDLIKLLTFSRILAPKSKLSTYDESDTYLKKFDLSLADVYRGLDVIEKLSDKLQAHLYKESEKLHKRKKGILYYDCTNYYFETEEEDEDILEDEDYLQYGLRKYGLSKEHRPNPLVQMGLFIDSDGLPVSFVINPGNTNEQKTPIPLQKKMLEDYKLSKYIYCSYAGLGSEENKQFNSFNGRAYIVTQSLKKLKEEKRKLILTDLNWTYANKEKASLTAIKEICDKCLRGEKLSASESEMLKRDLIFKEFPYKKKERLVITFSAKTYMYQRRLFLKQLNRAEEMVSKQNKFTHSNTDVRRLITQESATKEGEVAEFNTLTLNTKRIDKECLYHGFYAMTTSLEDDPMTLLKINKARWKIEACFRVMKTSFKARPIYLQKENRIKAHFMICFLSLLVFALLKAKINGEEKKITDRDIILTLKNMNIDIHKKGFGKALYTGSKTLDALEEAYGLELNRKYYQDTKIRWLMK